MQTALWSMPGQARPAQTRRVLVTQVPTQTRGAGLFQSTFVLISWFDYHSLRKLAPGLPEVPQRAD